MSLLETTFEAALNDWVQCAEELADFAQQHPELLPTLVAAGQAVVAIFASSLQPHR